MSDQKEDNVIEGKFFNWNVVWLNTTIAVLSLVIFNLPFLQSLFYDLGVGAAPYLLLDLFSFYVLYDFK